MAIGIARTLAGIATARATMRTRSARATDFAMTGKVAPAYGHFKRGRGSALPRRDKRIGFREDSDELARLDVVGNCGASMLAARGFHYPVFEETIGGFSAPINRFGRSNAGRAGASCGRVRPDPMDAMGSGGQRGPLPRSRRCGIRSNIISDRI